MRFATRVLFLQLATVVAVVALCAAVFIAMAVDQVREEAEETVLSIARSVAAQPTVRQTVDQETEDPEPVDPEDLENGPLQTLATATAERTGALFVVVTDIDGLRLAHPNPERLNEQVSTAYDAAMRGEEVVAWESGTLGRSVRAKVPVFSPDTGEPVGEVSVGVTRDRVFNDLPRLLLGIASVAGLGLCVGVVASVLLRRRWEKLTLGVQPEELVEMVHNQAAVLDGVADGVLAINTDGVVRVANSEAIRMLGPGDLVGRELRDLGLPEEVLTDLREEIACDSVPVGDRVLYLDSRTVFRGGRVLGSVVIVRDRTDLVALSERLDSVQAMGSALRVQRHEFANRMHVAVGLLESGRTEDATDFLRTMRDRGPVDFPLNGGEALTEPFLRSFLGAAALEAGERGVSTHVTDDTLVLGTVAEPEDVATVLGNLFGNAVSAAAAAPEPRRVDVTLLDEGDTLVLIVADSGAGIANEDDRLAARPAPDGVPDTVHGHGVGLRLCRDLVRRRGGDLWLIDRGGEEPGKGAVFGARLPGVMRAEPIHTTEGEF